MRATGIDDLTEAQRASLRLVLLHHSSKEIAAIFGVSPSAIDKRIERAVQVLGVTTRFEAARLLDRHEQGGNVSPGQNGTTYERVPSEPIDLSPMPLDTPSVDRIEPLWLVRRFVGAVPRSGSERVARNRLSSGDRLIRLVGVMGLIAITTMALLNMTTTLSGLLTQARARNAPTQGTVRTAPMTGRDAMSNTQDHTLGAAGHIRAGIEVPMDEQSARMVAA